MSLLGGLMALWPPATQLHLSRLPVLGVAWGEMVAVGGVEDMKKEAYADDIMYMFAVGEREVYLWRPGRAMLDTFFTCKILFYIFSTL